MKRVSVYVVTSIVSGSIVLGCYDAVAPSAAVRPPVPERVRADGFGSPPPAFSGSLSINPNSYIVLPTFSYTTWVEFSVTGAVILESLPGSRTTYSGPVYAHGVWSQDSNCGLRVSIIYPAASIDAKQTCGQGPNAFVDTIPVKSSGTAQRGPMPFETSDACLPSLNCHQVSGTPQLVTMNVLPVTLNKLKASPRLVNFAVVPYAYVDFTASRTPTQFTTDGNTIGTPVTTTAWIFDAVDGADEQVWAYCPFPGYTTLLCRPSLHRAGRMTVKAFAGGWEQTSSVTVQCPVAGDSALNDTIGDFAVRSALLKALDSSNVDSSVHAGFAPGSNKGYRREQGGTIWRLPDNSYVPVFDLDTGATQCHFRPNAANSPGPGAEPYAVFHTHPSDSGTVVYGCSKDPKTNLLPQQYPGGPGPKATANPEGNGGGSVNDWNYANNQMVRVYVISKRTRVSRLDPGHPGGDSTNTNRWFAKGLPAKCQWVK